MAFTRIHHVGMVTSDLDVARNLFCNGFGLSVDEHRTPWPGDENSGPVTSVEFPIGEMFYKVSRPNNSSSSEARFLNDTNGRGGIHYISIASDDIQADLETLLGRGLRLKSDWNGSGPVSLDPATTQGLEIEIRPDDHYYVHPYFRGKGLVEESIAASGLSYAILRPTLIFGVEDILLNNIAWAVRRFPIVPIPGDGAYGLQPISVEDLASLAVEAAKGDDRAVMDAVGPERYSYESLVRLVADALGRRPWLLHVPGEAALGLSRVLGLLLRDTMLTRDEVKGLMAGLLVSDEPPRGTASLRAWVAEHAGALGRRYASEVARHYR